MAKKYFCISLFLIFVLNPSYGFAADGVLIAGPASEKPTGKQKLRQVIEEYVKQVVHFKYLEIVERVIQDALLQQNFPVYPQIVQHTVYQAAMEAMNQPSIKQLTRDAYKKALDRAVKEQEEGVAQAAIQQNVQNEVTQVLYGIRSDPAFKRIIEYALNQAVAQHKQIVVQQAAQRQMQFALFQKQQQALQLRMQEFQRQIIQKYQEEWQKQMEKQQQQR